MLTQANDGLCLHFLILVLGEIQKELQHLVLDDNLKTTNKTDLKNNRLENSCSQNKVQISDLVIPLELLSVKVKVPAQSSYSEERTQ